MVKNLVNGVGMIQVGDLTDKGLIKVNKVMNKSNNVVNDGKFPWITMSILVAAIVVLLIINKSALPDKTKINVAWGIMCGLMVGMFTFIGFGIRKMIKNTKRFNMFRSTLKIGDMTAEGVVMDIEGDEVTIAKTTKLHLVYPPKSDEDNINLI